MKINIIAGHMIIARNTSRSIRAGKAERRHKMDLFEYMRQNTMEKESPLAARMRPTTLSEIVGQRHILGEDKLLYLSLIHI